MAWPNLRYEQTNLAALCRPRPVVATEYHLQNQLYGLAWLLKEYADLPRDEPLPWAMEHCISFDSPEPYFAELETRLPILLAVTQAQADVLRPRVARPVHAIGSAFFYMQQLYRQQHDDEPTERRGTLVFPDKSTTLMDTDFDRERLARALAALPAEYQPVAVSVFWKDFERRTYRPYEKAGLMLVSSGHPYDPHFLFRQHDLCRKFKYACANDLSSSFCMAVLAGCRFFHWPAGPVRMTREGKTCSYEQDPTLALPGKQACLAAAPFPPGDNEAVQRALAERFAGKAMVRSPAFFRALRAEGRRLLQAAPPPALRFDSGVRLDQLAGWLAQGIDLDGWVSRHGRLVIPGRAGHAGVRLLVDVAGYRRLLAGRLSAKLTLTLDDSERRSCRLPWGQSWLAIPVAPDGRPHLLRFECDHDIALPDQRRRALRLLAIDWEPHRAGQPSLPTNRAA